MTLEDFFTLTEIKDGLTATSRVEELVFAMQRNKDSVVKNAGDASRQWDTVASTIAATKNKECLDVFMRLDGLHYFSRWLSDAQRLSNDSTDSSIEKSILALLQALENLGVDSPRSISSGIWHTVKNLVDHGSSRVQDLARRLFDSWRRDKVYDHSECNNESASQLRGDETRVIASSGETNGPKFPSADPLLSGQSNDEETHVRGIDEVGNLLSGKTGKNKPDGGKGLEPQNDKLEFISNTISNCCNTKVKVLDGPPTYEITNAVQESLPVEEKYSTRDTAPTGTGSPLHPKQGSVEGPSDAPAAAELSRDEKHTGTENSGAAVVVASDSVGPAAVSSDSAVASDKEIKKEPILQKNVDSSEVKRISSDPKCGSEDVGMTHSCSKQVLPLTRRNSKYDSDTSSETSGDHHRHRKDESFGTSIHDAGVKKGDIDHANGKRRVKRRKKRASRSTTLAQRLGAIDRTTADIELGIVDALEVATKVAQEVAREVDSREASCGSSEELSDESGQSASPDSINGEEDTPCTFSPSKEVPVGENNSVEASHGGRDHLIDPKDDKPENGTNNNKFEHSQTAATARQLEVSTEKSPCDFDLNQEVYSDETDPAMSSIPAPIISVSRPVAAPGVPATPLQLERTLGWKGSAATSAFRPASPHKVSGGDLKEKQAGLGIDLNVAEGGDDKVEDLTPGKLFPFTSNLRSANSSLEARHRESDRFKLDLNCTNDDEDAPPPLDSRTETRLFLSRNGHQSASPASSSSSAQPSVKKVNIDLNDRPQFLIDTYDQGPYHGRHPWSTAPFGGHKSDEPVISIFGTKVEVNKKDFLPPVSSFLPNGKSLETTLDLNMSRTGDALGLPPGVSYPPTPIYGYNGLAAHPGTSFSSPMYVPGMSIPYMMDSRGAPVIMPQVFGSTPHVQAAYPQQPVYPPQQPFFMNAAGGSLSLNGSGPIQPNSDRSSGFGVEGGNRDSLSLRQFLSPGQGRPVGEHPGANAESSSGFSIVGGKRKEPETGWAPYTLNSRPQYPPWR